MNAPSNVNSHHPTYQPVLPPSVSSTRFYFLWLEITRRCNLECVHCYADSSPHATSGRMSEHMWCSAIDEAGQLGVKRIQFIGGEPTIYPAFPELVSFAAKRNMSIEVYSNLSHLDPALWDLFALHRVSIATSFYSIHPDIHNRITNGQTHAKTLANIREAVARNLNLRVGMVDVLPGQDIPETTRVLRDLGVRNIKVDRSRGVGRAQLQGKSCDVDQLCGSCGHGKAAIDCDGNVFPCVFSRWLCVGNVLSNSLGEVLLGKQMLDTDRYLQEQFKARPGRNSSSQQTRHGRASIASCDPSCDPNCTPCAPHTCDPSCDPNCTPCAPHTCDPSCDPNCTPCAPHTCDPSCDPNCTPCAPHTCDPSCDPNCTPCAPNTCDPSCDPNCTPCAPHTCDPSCDPNCNPSTCDPDSCDPCDPLTCAPCDPSACDPCDPSTCDPDSCDPCDPLTCDPCDPSDSCDPLTCDPSGGDDGDDDG